MDGGRGCGTADGDTGGLLVIDDLEVEALMDDAFFAMATAHREKVALRIDPAAWPIIGRSRWGANQTARLIARGRHFGWMEQLFVTGGHAVRVLDSRTWGPGFICQVSIVAQVGAGAG